MHEYSGEYTLDDYLLANRLSYGSKRSTKIARILILVLLVFPVLIIIGNPSDVVSWAFIIFLLVMLFYPYTILPVMVKRLFSEQKQLHGQAKIVLDGNRIITTGSTGEATHLWLHHYLEAEQMILLYATPNTFIMLPRRFLLDDSEYEYARQFLKDFPMHKTISREVKTDSSN